ncbi:hypothetical protein Tco_0006741 [Tanacetum coccineum]
MEPRKSEEEKPLKEVDKMNEVERKADGKPAKSVRENVTKNEEEEPIGVSSSHTVGYYLKHQINQKLIKGLVENQKFNDSCQQPENEDIGGNFKIPCSIGGLKHTNALVDQGSDVNVMPFSTYNKLTDERPAETDIRLSLASHSYIYPLGIANDVLVDVAAKAVIKFDKGMISLKSRKSKISFHRIPESLYRIETGIKNNIDPIAPIAPIMTMNRLVLEWEEMIKLHQKKEMEFNQ